MKEIMNQWEIRDLKDDKEKLRAILGGFKTCTRFFKCFIQCHCRLVEENEDFQIVQEFIKKYNLNINDFCTIGETYLRGDFHPCNGDFGLFIPDLKNILIPYKPDENHRYPGDFLYNNGFGEDELIGLIEQTTDSINENLLSSFINKYNLTTCDFAVLSKTMLNNGFHSTLNHSENIIPDLKEVLESYDITREKLLKLKRYSLYK